MRISFRTLACNALIAVAAAILASGCAAPSSSLFRDSARVETRIATLQASLKDLGPATDPDEARRVAYTAVADSLKLAEDYRVATPALWHNLLIQMGVRERGLCYHWTEDLMKRLQALDLKSYQLHWGVAHKGSDLREHNSVVVTARNQPFDTGLVLDPWRNSGELAWAAVRQDEYPWEPLPRDQW
ncbi:MAG: hypothetical protein MUC33_23775 [Desulfobacterales bacterium]|jgi:hypothetical protein|nr:hypothetical protein [Desulfobacterales bacterium]